MLLAPSYISQFEGIIEAACPQLSTVRPSEWTEQRMVMGKPRPGRFRYDWTPYAREPIDCLGSDHPCRKLAVMKGAQIGFSSGVLVPFVGWMIENNPGNTYLMVGAPALIEPAMAKIDAMLDVTGLRDMYIRSATTRKKSMKTGDTNETKEFVGGYLKVGSANNHKNIAQVDLDFILLDDLDQMKGTSRGSGNLLKLIEKRAASRKDTYKMAMISTPMQRASSLILPAYLWGDQRKWFVECPHCHEPIIFKMNVADGEVINALKDDKATNAGGLVWGYNSLGQVDAKTVGYVCYKCGGWFDDHDKSNMLNGGFWDATAVPNEEDYYSYHIPALYAPPGMFDWLKCARDYVSANPVNGVRNEFEHQVFVNTVEGEPYEPSGEAPTASVIMRNMRDYEPGVVPEKLSMSDGNGRIIMITCGADCNGKMAGYKSEVNDARLDYEIVAHSETGATYSILHGSIGTFKSKQGKKIEDRTHWTYEHNKHNSVWPILEKILAQKFKTDTGREMPVWLTTLDSGAFATNGVYPYLEKTNNKVVGVKGDKEDRYQLMDRDARLFKKALERGDLFILQTGIIKDRLVQWMNLKWDESDVQPEYFMNFPHSGKYVCPVKKGYSDTHKQEYDGEYLYTFENFFEHYEAEHRTNIVDKDGVNKFRWVKKNSGAQNHMLDCRVYNISAREIALAKVAESYKIKGLTWGEFVETAKKFIQS